MYALLRELGLGRGKRKESLNRVSKKKEVIASYFLWLKRGIEWSACDGSIVGT